MPTDEKQKMTYQTLSQLLRYGLFGGDCPLATEPLSEEEWSALFDESRRQAVTALAFDAILKLPRQQRPRRGVLFHFMSMTQTIETDNRRREQALSDFSAFLYDKLSLPTVVVKGTSLASYYPEPLHRECGDNDLYTGAATPAIEQLIRGMGHDVDNEDERHAAFLFEETMFECHNRLLYHNDDPVWTTVPLSGNLMHLPAEEEAFFVAKHIEHHAVFFNEPIRLRDLVDWCRLLMSEGFDYERLNQLKKGTDVEVFADLMTAYCYALFGIRAGTETSDIKGVSPLLFKRLYMDCPERHRLAIVRVARRSWKYMRYGREFRKIYGQSMFRRFYINNVINAIRNRVG